MTIPNIIETNEKENSLIVNIDDQTIITTVIEDKI